MKKCPQCNREYSDETLNFCLDDGTVLIAVRDVSTDENIQRPTEQQTEILSQEQVTEAIPVNNKTANNIIERETIVKSQPAQNDSQPQIIKQGVSPIFAYLSVGLLGLLVLIAGIGLVFWLNSNSNKDTNTELVNNNVNENISNLSNSETQVNGNKNSIELSKTEKSTPKTTPTKKPTATPKEESNTKPTPTATTSPTQTPKPIETPIEEKGKFFVILGSYKNPAKAKNRLQLARSKGLPARIINTNKVPGLRSGFLSVVIGPLSKPAAQKALGRAKSVASDAYIKEG